MAVISTNPTSRRAYLSQDELEQYADISITDATEADDKISQAEEIIDAYVGFIDKFMGNDLLGVVGAVSATSITLQTDQCSIYEADYFKLAQIEIVKGTGVGQRRTITGSTKAGVLTVPAWETNPDTSSLYKIFQHGKFPRPDDVDYFSSGTTQTYIKHIPENVKRAVAAQVEYLIAMGETFFKTNEAELQSENLGDYSYTKGEGAVGIQTLIAPKAKLLLRGFTNRVGKVVL